MTNFADCQTARDADGVEYIRIPDGYVICLMPKDTAAALSEWTECCAVRVTTEDGTIAALEVTRDMEWVTGPEAGK